MMAGDLAGRTAIVTGGARGIGEAYVRALAAEGARVAIVDLLEGPTRMVADSLGDRGLAVVADVADAAAMRAAAAEVKNAWGQIDILINNAAIFADDSAEFAPLAWDMMSGDLADWRRLRAVNVEGVVNGIRAVAPYMQARRYGRIINQSSVGGFVDASGIYGLSKLEVAALTRMYACQLGPHGITVNAIAPGITATAAVVDRPGRTEAEAKSYLETMAGLSPAKRIGTPLDMVEPLLFFASERTSFINGQILLVDGGWVRRL
jgi:NAD(P)-dependent dehydrogenase (short-subunit alcohol dehydrogenase family)